MQFTAKRCRRRMPKMNTIADQSVHETGHNGNVVDIFIRHAKHDLDKTALIIPSMEGQQCIVRSEVSFRELLQHIQHFQQLLKGSGFVNGDRIIVVIKPSVTLFSMLLAMLGLGIIPVFIDRGMGKDKISMAVKDAKAKAIISHWPLLKWFFLMPPLWSLKRFCIERSGPSIEYLQTLIPASDGADKICQINQQTISAIKKSADETGLITYTSGSTGRPKGANRTHGTLIAQHEAAAEYWPDVAGDKDMSCFPVFALRNVACGITTILPELDLSQISNMDPARILDQIERERITRLSAAPAFLQALCSFLQEQHKTLDQISGVAIGGATVSYSLAVLLRKTFPKAEICIVYGSTESEPISLITLQEFLRDGLSQPGYLVGPPARVSNILIADLPIAAVSEQQLIEAQVGNGQVGEILVSGKHVLSDYIDNELETSLNKIFTEAGTVWHRTGDTGYRDNKGRIWLTGRCNDVLTIKQKKYQPLIIEQTLDAIEGVNRTAIIQSNKTAVIFIDVFDSCDSPSALMQTLHKNLDSKLKSLTMILVRNMPVDGRHNSKIDRPKLRKWMDRNRRRLASVSSFHGSEQVID